ncbi:hypothetical protein, partial [Chryseobacterium fistulae]
NKKLIPHNFVFWQYFLDHIFDLFYYGQFIPESRGQFNQNLQIFYFYYLICIKIMKSDDFEIFMFYMKNYNPIEKDDVLRNYSIKVH